MLDKLEIHNYKSLRRVNLGALPSLLVMVGANATGKSNFADALHFLSLVARVGLAGAVRAKGGYENITFRRERRSKVGVRFRISAQIDPYATFPAQGGPTEAATRQFVADYEFAFRATTQAIAAEYRVVEENLRLYLGQGRGADDLVLQVTRFPEPKIVGGPALQGDLARNLMFLSMEHVQSSLTSLTLPVDELLLVVGPLRYIVHPLTRFFQLLQAWRVHQFWPQVGRQTGVPSHSPELGRFGEDLPAAVDFLKRTDPESFGELVAHVQRTVPSIGELETDYVETKQLGLFFKEQGIGKRWFSLDVSDGTIQTVSLFLVLVDRRAPLLVIEEPENSLHPWILRHFIEVCRDKSEQKQILIITQSVVAVNAVPPDSLFLVSRVRGETQIRRSTEVRPGVARVIQENLMGLGEYWDSGALGGVPTDQASLFEGE